MGVAKELADLLIVMVKHEETIGELYGLFARKFPEHERLWSDLSRQEMEHADWIRRLYAKTEDGSVSVCKERFDIGEAQTSLNYVRVLMANARQPISLSRAFSMAMEIENSLLEKKFYEVFEGDSEELKRAFELLVLEIQQHIAKIQKAQAALRKKNA